jgi:hypothetical protein
MSFFSQHVTGKPGTALKRQPSTASIKPKRNIRHGHMESVIVKRARDKTTAGCLWGRSDANSQRLRRALGTILSAQKIVAIAMR